MENLAGVLVLLLGGSLAGALWNCWQGRERRAQPRRWTPFQFRVIWAPRGRPQPPAPTGAVPDRAVQQPKPEGQEGKMAYTDQVLAEGLLAARRRVAALQQLDERLRKPASSLGWAGKT
jgi:hypothetical protein